VIRLGVRVAREHAELVLAELLTLAPSGVEEIDDGGPTVEYAVYGSAGEVPTLPDVDAAAGAALVEVCTTEIPDDWSERWRAFHRPVLIAPPADAPSVPALHVRPPWEAPSPSIGSGAPAQEIVIDPGQAFGTGAHGTTRLCIEFLLELAARGLATGPLIDVGCGSGVLAIAAARLGYEPVIALDHEAESVLAASENAQVNSVALDVRRFDLRRQAVPSGWPSGAPTVVANLLRPLLLELSLGQAPAQLIASGLLVAEVDEIVAAYTERYGLVERERREAGEWGAVWLSPREPGRRSRPAVDTPLSHPPQPGANRRPESLPIHHSEGSAGVRLVSPPGRKAACGAARAPIRRSITGSPVGGAGACGEESSVVTSFSPHPSVGGPNPGGVWRGILRVDQVLANPPDGSGRLLRRCAGVRRAANGRVTRPS